MPHLVVKGRQTSLAQTCRFFCSPVSGRMLVVYGVVAEQPNNAQDEKKQKDEKERKDKEERERKKEEVHCGLYSSP